MGASSDSFADYHRWADVLATTAVMGAIVVTPLASVAMQLLAPRLREVRPLSPHRLDTCFVPFPVSSSDQAL